MTCACTSRTPASYAKPVPISAGASSACSEPRTGVPLSVGSPPPRAPAKSSSRSGS